MPRYRDLLANKNFIFYSVGQMLSQFGDRFIQMALIGVVSKTLQGTSVHLANIMILSLLPAFFISPAAGVYIDRWNKKNVLVLTSFIMAALVIAIPLFFLKTGSFFPLYVCVFLIFAAACFFLPAKMAIVPELVGKDKLLLANSMATILWIAAGVFGFTMGGYIIEYLGPEKGLYLNAAIYAVAAIMALFIKRTMTDFEQKRMAFIKDIVIKPPKTFIADFKEGMHCLFNDPNAKIIGMIFFTASSVAGALYVATIIFIQDVTGTTTSRLGLLGLFVGAGFMLGSYFFGKLGGKFARAKSIFLSFILTGAFVAVFPVLLKEGAYSVADIALFFVGLSASPVMTFGNTFLHEGVDEKLRGRIFSSIGILMNAGFIFFMFISGRLAQWVSNFWIITICGAALLISGVAGILFYKEK